VVFRGGGVMGDVSLCTLRVGDEVFGFETGKICEVLGERIVQPVPLAPKFVAGVIPYRGEVLMVLCFRTLLGMQPSCDTANVIVLEDKYAGELFGLAVDSMGELLSPDAEDYEENSQGLDARRGALFAGVYKSRDSTVIHLKPELLWPMRLMNLFGE
jgi:purine-binding chemotaxis protein CheW